MLHVIIHTHASLLTHICFQVFQEFSFTWCKYTFFTSNPHVLKYFFLLEKCSLYQSGTPKKHLFIVTPKVMGGKTNNSCFKMMDHIQNMLLGWGG
jgi:hypothetical protein